jgi:anti-anti-sigma factor
MTCEVERRDGCLRVRGEMTIYHAALLKDEVVAPVVGEAGPWVVNLAEVSDLDTAGLQILLMAARACAARSEAFSLEDPSPVVRETLRLLRPQGLAITTIHESRS